MSKEDCNIINITNDKISKNITFFFKINFWRYDTEEFIKLLSSNHNITVVNNDEELINNLETTDILVVSSEACNVIDLLFENEPSFFEKKKLIFIRTLTTWDILHINEKKMLHQRNIYLKNIYIPLNKIVFDKDGKTIALPKKRNYVDLLHSYGNVEIMPLYTCSKIPKLNKKQFYKKYNLDLNKDIFTIFLSFPKNYINQGVPLMNQWIETQIFCDNNYWLSSVIKHLQSKFNVVFKAHPLHNMKFKPFVAGKVWKKNEKRTAISLSTMQYYIDKYTFIEMEDGHDINIYTKMGMIFNRSTFGYSNYLFDIPLLYISSNSGLLQKQFSYELKNKYDIEKIFYGSWTTIELFEQKYEQILNKFIEEYSKSTNNFKYKHDNILYGDSYNLNVQTWVDYVNDVINKPIK